MPGTFNPASLPKRPGVYVRHEAQGPEIILPAFGGIVAIPFTHDWGPAETPVLCTSYAQFTDTFGDSYTPGHIAVRGAFYGEGMPGRMGAGAVLCYRMVGTAGASAARSLQNTAPAAAITLTAKYPGARGNNLKVAVQDKGPSEPTKDELILYYGTVELERYTFLQTDITDLAAQINAASDWVTAGSVTSGVALTAQVTPVGFTTTTGADGGTLVAQDWTDMMTGLGVERFGLFSPFDLTDSSILTSLKAWIQDLNDHGRRCLAVVGGAVDESLSAAQTRAASLNSENFVSLGVGSYTDLNFQNPATNAATVMSTSQLAPRMAGILAAKGDGASATFARLAGLTIRTGPTESNITSAFDSGLVVIARDADPVAPTHLERSLTTYTTATDPAKPYLIYRNPKFMRTLHIFEAELQEWQGSLIGNLPVNDKSRRAVIAEAIARLNARVDRGVIQPDPIVMPSTNPPPSPADEFIAVDYGVAFGRSAEQILNTIRFS